MADSSSSDSSSDSDEDPELRAMLREIEEFESATQQHQDTRDSAGVDPMPNVPMPQIVHQPPKSIEFNIDTFHNLPPSEQISYIGEDLYAKIRAKDPHRAGKITGMLLEMDVIDLLRLVDSPDFLQAKIEEAVSIFEGDNSNASAKTGQMKIDLPEETCVDNNKNDIDILALPLLSVLSPLGCPPPYAIGSDGDLPLDTRTIVNKLRVNMKKKGREGPSHVGFIGLQRKFGLKNKLANTTLNLADFMKEMKEFDLNLSDRELEILFNHFDADKSGTIISEEFIRVVRDPLTDRRRKLVDLAFAIYDKDGSGIVNAKDITSTYDAARHPDVLAGKATPQQILAHFLENFDIGGVIDGKITKAEFVNYYSNLGASIEDDDYFKLMIRNAWNIPGDPTMATPRASYRKEESLKILFSGSDKVISSLMSNGVGDIEELKFDGSVLLPDEVDVYYKTQLHLFSYETIFGVVSRRIALLFKADPSLIVPLVESSPSLELVKDKKKELMVDGLSSAAEGSLVLLKHSLESSLAIVRVLFTKEPKLCRELLFSTTEAIHEFCTNSKVFEHLAFNKRSSLSGSLRAFVSDVLLINPSSTIQTRSGDTGIDISSVDLLLTLGIGLGCVSDIVLVASILSDSKYPTVSAVFVDRFVKKALPSVLSSLAEERNATNGKCNDSGGIFEEALLSLEPKRRISVLQQVMAQADSSSSLESSDQITSKYQVIVIFSAVQLCLESGHNTSFNDSTKNTQTFADLVEFIASRCEHLLSAKCENGSQEAAIQSSIVICSMQLLSAALNQILSSTDVFAVKIALGEVLSSEINLKLKNTLFRILNTPFDAPARDKIISCSTALFSQCINAFYNWDEKVDVISRFIDKVKSGEVNVQDENLMKLVLQHFGDMTNCVYSLLIPSSRESVEEREHKKAKNFEMVLKLTNLLLQVSSLVFDLRATKRLTAKDSEAPEEYHASKSLEVSVNLVVENLTKLVICDAFCNSSSSSSSSFDIVSNDNSVNCSNSLFTNLRVIDFSSIIIEYQEVFLKFIDSFAEITEQNGQQIDIHVGDNNAFELSTAIVSILNHFFSQSGKLVNYVPQDSLSRLLSTMLKSQTRIQGILNRCSKVGTSKTITTLRFLNDRMHSFMQFILQSLRSLDRVDASLESKSNIGYFQSIVKPHMFLESSEDLILSSQNKLLFGLVDFTSPGSILANILMKTMSPIISKKNHMLNYLAGLDNSMKRAIFSSCAAVIKMNNFGVEALAIAEQRRSTGSISTAFVTSWDLCFKQVSKYLKSTNAESREKMSEEIVARSKLLLKDANYEVSLEESPDTASPNAQKSSKTRWNLIRKQASSIASSDSEATPRTQMVSKLQSIVRSDKIKNIFRQRRKIAEKSRLGGRMTVSENVIKFLLDKSTFIQLRKINEIRTIRAFQRALVFDTTSSIISQLLVSTTDMSLLQRCILSTYKSLWAFDSSHQDKPKHEASLDAKGGEEMGEDDGDNHGRIHFLAHVEGCSSEAFQSLSDSYQNLVSSLVKCISFGVNELKSPNGKIRAWIGIILHCLKSFAFDFRFSDYSILHNAGLLDVLQKTLDVGDFEIIKISDYIIDLLAAQGFDNLDDDVSEESGKFKRDLATLISSRFLRVARSLTLDTPVAKPKSVFSDVTVAVAAGGQAGVSTVSTDYPITSILSDPIVIKSYEGASYLSKSSVSLDDNHSISFWVKPGHSEILKNKDLTPQVGASVIRGPDWKGSSNSEDGGCGRVGIVKKITYLPRGYIGKEGKVDKAVVNDSTPSQMLIYRGCDTITQGGNRIRRQMSLDSEQVGTLLRPDKLVLSSVHGEWGKLHPSMMELPLQGRLNYKPFDIGNEGYTKLVVDGVVYWKPEAVQQKDEELIDDVTGRSHITVYWPATKVTKNYVYDPNSSPPIFQVALADENYGGSIFNKGLVHNSDDISSKCKPGIKYWSSYGANLLADGGLGVVIGTSAVASDGSKEKSNMSIFNYRSKRSVVQDMWNHVVIVKSGNSSSIYLNGEFDVRVDIPITYEVTKVEESEHEYESNMRFYKTIDFGPDIYVNPPLNRAAVPISLGQQGDEWRGLDSGSTYYCSRRLGKSVIRDSDGQCGPTSGPQCPDCLDITRSTRFNRAGFPMTESTNADNRNMYYCGRAIDREAISAGTACHCGPNQGPQCPDCRLASSKNDTASGITITFDEKSATETNYDFVRFYKDDSHTTHWGDNKYHGRQGRENFPGVKGIPPLIIEASKFVLYFESDGGSEDYGYKIYMTGTSRCKGFEVNSAPFHFGFISKSILLEAKVEEKDHCMFAPMDGQLTAFMSTNISLSVDQIMQEYTSGIRKLAADDEAINLSIQQSFALRALATLYKGIRSNNNSSNTSVSRVLCGPHIVSSVISSLASKNLSHVIKHSVLKVASLVFENCDYETVVSVAKKSEHSVLFEDSYIKFILRLIGSVNNIWTRFRSSSTANPEVKCTLYNNIEANLALASEYTYLLQHLILNNQSWNKAFLDILDWNFCNTSNLKKAVQGPAFNGSLDELHGIFALLGGSFCYGYYTGSRAVYSSAPGIKENCTILGLANIADSVSSQVATGDTFEVLLDSSKQPVDIPSSKIEASTESASHERLASILLSIFPPDSADFGANIAKLMAFYSEFITMSVHDTRIEPHKHIDDVDVAINDLLSESKSARKIAFEASTFDNKFYNQAVRSHLKSSCLKSLRTMLNVDFISKEASFASILDPLLASTLSDYTKARIGSCDPDVALERISTLLFSMSPSPMGMFNDDVTNDGIDDNANDDVMADPKTPIFNESFINTSLLLRLGNTKKNVEQKPPDIRNAEWLSSHLKTPKEVKIKPPSDMKLEIESAHPYIRGSDSYTMVLVPGATKLRITCSPETSTRLGDSINLFACSSAVPDVRGFIKNKEKALPTTRLTFESEHSYKNSMDHKFEISIPGAIEMVVVFDSNCSTEGGCDYLRFHSDASYSDKSIIGQNKYTGSSWPSLTIPGDKCYARFISDGSGTDWGYKFDVIKPIPKSDIILSVPIEQIDSSSKAEAEELEEGAVVADTEEEDLASEEATLRADLAASNGDNDEEKEDGEEGEEDATDPRFAFLGGPLPCLDSKGSKGLMQRRFRSVLTDRGVAYRLSMDFNDRHPDTSIAIQSRADVDAEEVVVGAWLRCDVPGHGILYLPMKSNDGSEVFFTEVLLSRFRCSTQRGVMYRNSMDFNDRSCPGPNSQDEIDAEEVVAGEWLKCQVRDKGVLFLPMVDRSDGEVLFTKIPSTGGSAKAQPPPICGEGHDCLVSSTAEGGYRSGWVCDICRKSGSSDEQRWNCFGCTFDACFSCRPYPGVTSDFSSPENLFNLGNDARNKWRCINSGNSCLQADFERPYRVFRYGVCSANDSPEQDPESFELLGRDISSGEWNVLDVVTDCTFLKRWDWRWFTIDIPIATDSIKLVIKKTCSEKSRKSRPLSVGERVILSRNYESISDAAHGFLKPGDVGVVVRLENDGSGSHVYEVSCNSDSWYYQEDALVPETPESVDATSSPSSCHVQLGHFLLEGDIYVVDASDDAGDEERSHVKLTDVSLWGRNGGNWPGLAGNPPLVIDGNSFTACFQTNNTDNIDIDEEHANPWGYKIFVEPEFGEDHYETNIHAAPDSKSIVVHRLPVGASVTATSTKQIGSWLYVHIDNHGQDIIGWVNLRAKGSYLENSDLKMIFELDSKSQQKYAFSKKLTFESRHNYEDSMDHKFEISIPGAIEMVVVFDSNCSTEGGCDYLRFHSDASYSDKSIIGQNKYTGSSWPSLTIPGDKCYARFISDGSGTDWGYKFDVTARLPDNKKVKVLGAKKMKISLHSPSYMSNAGRSEDSGNSSGQAENIESNEWTCATCTLINDALVQICSVCESPRTPQSDSSTSIASPASLLSDSKCSLKDCGIKLLNCHFSDDERYAITEGDTFEFTLPSATTDTKDLPRLCVDPLGFSLKYYDGWNFIKCNEGERTRTSFWNLGVLVQKNVDVNDILASLQKEDESRSKFKVEAARSQGAISKVKGTSISNTSLSEESSNNLTASLVYLNSLISCHGLASDCIALVVSNYRARHENEPSILQLVKEDSLGSLISLLIEKQKIADSSNTGRKSTYVRALDIVKSNFAGIEKSNVMKLIELSILIVKSFTSPNHIDTDWQFTQPSLFSLSKIIDVRWNHSTFCSSDGSTSKANVKLDASTSAFTLFHHPSLDSSRLTVDSNSSSDQEFTNGACFVRGSSCNIKYIGNAKVLAPTSLIPEDIPHAATREEATGIAIIAPVEDEVVDGPMFSSRSISLPLDKIDAALERVNYIRSIIRDPKLMLDFLNLSFFIINTALSSFPILTRANELIMRSLCSESIILAVKTIVVEAKVVDSISDAASDILIKVIKVLSSNRELRTARILDHLKDFCTTIYREGSLKAGTSPSAALGSNLLSQFKMSVFLRIMNLLNVYKFESAHSNTCRRYETFYSFCSFLVKNNCKQAVIEVYFTDPWIPSDGSDKASSTGTSSRDSRYVVKLVGDGRFFINDSLTYQIPLEIKNGDHVAIRMDKWTANSFVLSVSINLFEYAIFGDSYSGALVTIDDYFPYTKAEARISSLSGSADDSLTIGRNYAKGTEADALYYETSPNELRLLSIDKSKESMHMKMLYDFSDISSTIHKRGRIPIKDINGKILFKFCRENMKSLICVGNSKKIFSTSSGCEKVKLRGESADIERQHVSKFVMNELELQEMKDVVANGTISDVNISDSDNFGYTALIFLASLGEEVERDKMKYLLSCDADPNLPDQYGCTALMKAIFSENPLAVVTLLLNHGADPNLAANDGTTALMEAVESNNAVIVKLLLDHGADRDAKKLEKNALDIAKGEGLESIVSILEMNAPDMSSISASKTLVESTKSRAEAKRLMRMEDERKAKEPTCVSFPGADYITIIFDEIDLEEDERVRILDSKGSLVYEWSDLKISPIPDELFASNDREGTVLKRFRCVISPDTRVLYRDSIDFDDKLTDGVDGQAEIEAEEIVQGAWLMLQLPQHGTVFLPMKSDTMVFFKEIRVSRFRCALSDKGVAYRLSMDFNDRHPDTSIAIQSRSDVDAEEVVVGAWLRCDVPGHGILYLPMKSNDGSEVFFQAVTKLSRFRCVLSTDTQVGYRLSMDFNDRRPNSQGIRGQSEIDAEEVVKGAWLKCEIPDHGAIYVPMKSNDGSEVFFTEVLLSRFRCSTRRGVMYRNSMDFNDRSCPGPNSQDEIDAEEVVAGEWLKCQVRDKGVLFLPMVDRSDGEVLFTEVPKPAIVSSSTSDSVGPDSVVKLQNSGLNRYVTSLEFKIPVPEPYDISRKSNLVTRGPLFYRKYNDEDGGEGSVGEVVNQDRSQEDVVMVKWRSSGCICGHQADDLVFLNYNVAITNPPFPGTNKRSANRMIAFKGEELFVDFSRSEKGGLLSHPCSIHFFPHFSSSYFLDSDKIEEMPTSASAGGGKVGHTSPPAHLVATPTSLLAEYKRANINSTLVGDLELMQYLNQCDKAHATPFPFWDAIAPSKELVAQWEAKYAYINLREYISQNDANPSRLGRRLRVFLDFNHILFQLLDSIGLEALTTKSPNNVFSNTVYSSREFIMDRFKDPIVIKALADSSVASSEQFALKFNRFRADKFASSGKVDHEAKYTNFSQAFRVIHFMDPTSLRKSDSLYRAVFVGENAVDAGGPYRETFTDFARELESPVLPLLIRTQNNRFILNPGSTSPTHFEMFKFLGKLMGIAFRSKLYLSLNISSIMWKLLILDNITIDDLKDHVRIFSELDQIKNLWRSDGDGCKVAITEDEFPIFYDGFVFVIKTSDGRDVDLCPDGSKKELTFANREEYYDLAIRFYLHEFDRQVEAVRQGLGSIIPLSILGILSWRDLELRVCGDNLINIETLKLETEYRGCSANDPHIKLFWQAVESFDNEQRKKLLIFVWGRSTLPLTRPFKDKFKIQPLSKPNPDIQLAETHTCFFTLDLPAYSTLEITKDKLLYAIANCTAMDNDGSGASGLTSDDF